MDINNLEAALTLKRAHESKMEQIHALWGEADAIKQKMASLGVRFDEQASTIKAVG